MACSNPDCRRTITDLQEQLSRLRSAGYDMLKQRGTWQAGGRSHHHLGQEYEELFDHEGEAAIESLGRESSVPEKQARKLLCDKFQSTFEKCKNVILDRMREALSWVLSVGGGSPEGTEEMYDICRAYGLLVHACHLGESESVLETSKEVPVLQKLEAVEDVHKQSNLLQQLSNSELSQFTQKASDLSQSLLTTVPPLVCDQPETSFCKECHEKEMKPLWDDSLGSYNLEYYRPTLFFSYEGRVARKGWVGNRPKAVTSTQADGHSTQAKGKDDSPGDCTGHPTVKVTVETEDLEAENPRPLQVAAEGLQQCPLHSGKTASILAALSLSGRGSADTDVDRPRTGIGPPPLVPLEETDSSSRQARSAQPVGKSSDLKGRGRKSLSPPGGSGTGNVLRGPTDQRADDRFSPMHVWLWK